MGGWPAHRRGHEPARRWDDGVRDERDDSPLRSVSIAISVLDCVAEDAELGATKMAARLGIAKSTACRMLAAPAARGLLERSRSGRYQLGPRLFEMGSSRWTG